MKKINSGFSSLGMSLIEIVIGILLLINPIGFTSGIIITFGIAMTIMGIAKIIMYFKTSAEEAAQKGSLATGIIFAVVGLFCTFRSDWFIATFPVITVLYGVLILMAGIVKIQKAVDMVRVRQNYWFVALISAILTLIFALLIIFNPFASTAVLWTFIGISLIVEAVMDVLTFIFSRKS